MIDIIIPHNNEEEFIAIAEKLGYKGLYFLYNLNDYLDKRKKLKLKNRKIKIYTGIIVDNRNIYKVKNILEKQSFSGYSEIENFRETGNAKHFRVSRKSKAFSSGLKNKRTFIVAKSSTNDKEAIEKLKPDVIFSFEDHARKDFIHQRASGFNHILCKSAKDNDVIIGFSLSSILNVENKHEILGRIMQNMKLCRKFKVKMLIASFAQDPLGMRSSHDLISLFKVLGCENPSFLGNV